MNLCDTNLSLACRQKLQDRLFDDEKLLWVGQPVPDPWASPAGFFCLFGAVWIIGTLYEVSHGCNPALLLLLIPMSCFLCAPLIRQLESSTIQ